MEFLHNNFFIMCTWFLFINFIIAGFYYQNTKKYLIRNQRRLTQAWEKEKAELIRLLKISDKS